VEFVAELIRKIRCKNAQSRLGGRGARKLKKTTHNSVVEASPYRNECFVPERRHETHAKDRHRPLYAGDPFVSCLPENWVARTSRAMTEFEEKNFLAQLSCRILPP
jgi:hypothetical protein